MAVHGGGREHGGNPACARTRQCPSGMGASQLLWQAPFCEWTVSPSQAHALMPMGSAGCSPGECHDGRLSTSCPLQVAAPPAMAEITTLGSVMAKEFGFVDANQ